MTTPTTRPRRSALAAGLAVLTATLPAAAFDLGLPRLEDLRPRFETVKLGMSPDDAVRAMANPHARTETQVMGVPHLTLAWRDLSNHYEARFLAGHLYFKQSTDAR